MCTLSDPRLYPRQRKPKDAAKALKPLSGLLSHNAKLEFSFNSRYIMENLPVLAEPPWLQPLGPCRRTS